MNLPGFTVGSRLEIKPRHNEMRRFLTEGQMGCKIEWYSFILFNKSDSQTFSGKDDILNSFHIVICLKSSKYCKFKYL